MPATLGLALAVSMALSGHGQVPAVLTPPPMPQSQSVEAYVREYFKDIPVMADIASCESHFRQFEKDGTVLQNENSTAVGVFQIMSSIHKDLADQNLGLDINTLEGNVAYARHLYEEHGTSPWNASKKCWNKVKGPKVALAK
jgi:hypothetical protein